MFKLRLSEIAELLGGQMVGTEDPVITGAAGIDHAGPGDLTFLARRKLVPALEACAAAAVLVGPEQEVSRPAVRVADPYGAFATFLERLLPDLDRIFPAGIHPTAVIDPEADVSRAAAIGPYCLVGPGTTLGTGTRLGGHVVLGCDVTMGDDCLVYSGVQVRENCLVGDRVILHAGVILGSDGFGYLPSAQGIRKVPQVGIVEIQDDVEIGAGSCIDRATTGRTVVGTGTKIDNLVQVGHNVTIGKMCTLCSQVGIAGSCTLEDGVIAGGQTGIADHLKIGAGAQLGAQSGIISDVEAGATVFGTPSVDISESLRMSVSLRKLPELLRRVTRLEKVAPAEKSGPNGRGQE